MRISELIKRLSDAQAIHGDVHVMILDGHNGGGTPRDINLGPVSRFIRPVDAEEAADCEDRVGEHIMAIGYGCY